MGGIVIDYKMSRLGQILKERQPYFSTAHLFLIYKAPLTLISFSSVYIIIVKSTESTVGFAILFSVSA